MQEFASLLNEVSEIATKTKINIDTMPSTITVLQAKDLYYKGKRTLAEAISTIPGINIWMTQTGWNMPVVRGNKNPETLSFDKVKLMIDGVTINSELLASITYYLDLPIELIERIEILRGTGSSLYGAGAYSAVINVITVLDAKKNTTKVFAAAGSYNAASVGFVKHFDIGDVHLGIDGFFYENDKTIKLEENKFVHPSNIGMITREQTTLEQKKDFTIGTKLEYKKLKWISRYKEQDNGNYFGFEEYIAPDDSYGNKHKILFSELQYSDKVFTKSILELKMGYFSYEADFDVSVPTDGILVDINLDAKELKTYADASLTTLYNNHTITLGLYHSHTESKKNELKGEVVLVGVSPVSISLYDGDLYNYNNARKNSAIYFQDLYEIQSNLLFSLGIRYDHYMHELEYTSYQLGLSYNINPSLTYKLMYSNGFRAPSWAEKYTTLNNIMKGGNPDLKEETIDTLEFAFVYKNRHHRLSTNFYYSKLKDVIDIGDVAIGDYKNFEQRTSKGVELEYRYEPSSKHRLDMSLSYVDANYFSVHDANAHLGDQSMPGVPPLLILKQIIFTN